MEKDIKKAVQENYARIAEQGSGCCGSSNSCCCGSGNAGVISRGIGYSEEDLTAVPDGANLGLGCGNPIALAHLKEGESVLDLGSGAGFDCFLAAARVEKKGRVIGVDMTPAMIARARENAAKGDYSNVEFRLGEIEKLPVADASVDVVISNCVINLSPDKPRVFTEIYRVLKPAGRMMVSDIVLLKPVPDFILKSVEMYVSCIAGASLKTDYLQMIEAAGLKDVEVLDEGVFPAEYMLNDPTVKAIKDSLDLPSEQVKELAASIASIKVCGWKL